jgi:hypothetical protein
VLIKICGRIIVGSSFELASGSLRFEGKMKVFFCVSLGIFETKVAKIGV